MFIRQLTAPVNGIIAAVGDSRQSSSGVSSQGLQAYSYAPETNSIGALPITADENYYVDSASSIQPIAGGCFVAIDVHGQMMILDPSNGPPGTGLHRRHLLNTGITNHSNISVTPKGDGIYLLEIPRL